MIALTIVLAAVASAGDIRFATSPVHGQDDVALRVLGGPPFSWDPAAMGDTTSAAMLAQVFEGLTALDPDDNVQPALAESWTISADALHIDFKLRPGLKYSDGTPIASQDFVESWFRVLDPTHPSPLVSVLDDVAGAADYVAGRIGRDGVGLHADGDHVLVDLGRPATYFVAVTTSPSLAVVPPSMYGSFSGPDLPATLVVSGAYRPASQTDESIRLEANANYWAGKPTLGVVEVGLDTGGRIPLDMFEAGDLDYLPIAPYNAAWIRYDRQLGPQLRQTPDLTMHYYGFDTTTPPFDDPLVRQAFAKAVDWDRIVRLGGGNPARSMVPPPIGDGTDEDYRPAHDPAAARDLLAQAGYVGGSGFPTVALTSVGFGYEEAVAAELEKELGIDISVEYFDFADLQARDAADEYPKFWVQIWDADYPHANDFLGLLLETGSASNEGHWSNPDYDALIAAAAAASDPVEQQRNYAAAQAILRDQVPVIPVDALQGWALSRDGLLGALPSGAGFLRYAGMAWASGQ